MNASSDHSLLFGMLALQIGFVTQKQLAEAMDAWRLEKSTPLGEILRRRGLIDPDDHADVEKLLAKLVKKHGDVTASLAALPIGDDLRAAVTSLDGGARDVSLSPPTAPPSNDSPPTLLPGHDAPAGRVLRPAGPMRYARLRPHAKGGLGEVSVAMDEELGREVALKEIQERFADHPDSRARFVREAEVTGHLEHPGVVPVYGLGAHADGRPFYAMRFIRGESMHEAIKRFHEADKGKRDPGERSLALRELLGRFVAVCDAVSYAHARGVIHRDLKPANVMLGDFGETLVVDWGLARLHEQDDPQATAPAAPVALSEGSGTATQLGQAVGTPAFMAPEQARGDQGKVGPASDVFSLGATLYELLTGAPPYAGSTAAEALAMAREGKIVPARQRKPAVPRALEAVCAKAMAAAAEGRYADARGLADDVRRWLADEPVEAYREPLIDRARRWGRRHRTLATTGLALLLAGVMGLGAGLWAVNRQRQKTVEAEARERERAAEAEENLEVARQVIDEVFVVTKDDPTFQRPRMEKAKGLLLTKTLPFYKRFRAQRPDDPALQRQEADQWYRVGEIEATLGHATEAIKALEKSRDVRLALLASDPELARDEASLAGTHNFLSILFKDLGRYRESREESDKARLIRSRLAAGGDADSRNRLAVTIDNLGLLLQAMGQYKQARQEHQAARQIRADLVATHPGVAAYQRGLARTHNNLGVLLVALGDWPAALREYGEAERLQLALVKADPDEPDHKDALARTFFNRAGLHRAAKRPEDARREYQKAHDLLARLVADNSDVPGYRKLLALILSGWGTFLRETGNLDDAGKRHDAAFALREKLASDHPELPEYQSDLAGSYNDLAELSFRRSKFDEGVARHRQARDLLAGLAKKHPAVSAFRSRFADTCNVLGNRLKRRGRQKEALHEYRQAREVWQKLAEEQPEVPARRADLSVACFNLGMLLGAMTAYTDADAEFRHVLELRTHLAKDQPGVAAHPRFLADTYFHRAEMLLAQGEPAKARGQLDEAHRIQTDLLETHGGVEDRADLARTCLRRGGITLDRKHLSQRLADLDQGVALAQQVRASQPDHPDVPQWLREGTASRAEVLDALLKPELADPAWEKALKLTALGERGAVRLQRATSRARGGDHRRAAAEAEELAGRANPSGETLYKLACVQALNAGAAAREASAPLAERQKRAEGYSKDALALLKRAADAGFFREPKNVARLKADADLAALGERDDFKRFLKSLEEAR